MTRRFREASLKAFFSLRGAAPVLLAIILLVSLAKVLIPSNWYAQIFTQNIWLNSFIGAASGSILAGNPITSYVLGGEMLKQGVGLAAVTAFLVAWVTVGLVQFPAEALLLGKKFALTRNLLSFIFSILVGAIVFLILNI